MALKVWIPLNGSIENKGISQCTVSGNYSFSSYGKIGQCLNSSDNLNISLPSIAGAKVWSFAFWGYAEGSLITSDWTLIARLNDGGSNFRIETCPPNGYGNGIYCYSNSNNTQYLICNNSILSPTGGYYDQWAHVCFTSDGQIISKYINGELIGTTQYTGSGAINGDFVLANNNKIRKNDLRIYDHCLSPKEVKEISQGLICHYKLDGFNGGVRENLALGTNTANTSTNTLFYNEQTGGSTRTIEYDNGTPVIVITRNSTVHSGWQYFSYNNINSGEIKTSTVYTISFDVNASVNGSIGLLAFMQGNATNSKSASARAIQGNFYADKWSHIVLQTTTKSDFTGIASTGQVIYMSCGALAATGTVLKMKNMKMEIGEDDTAWCPAKGEAGYSDSILVDSSGLGNNLTKSGTVYTSDDSPRFNSSTDFQNSGYFYKNNFNCYLDKLTISYWLKVPSASSAQHFLLGSFDSWTNNGFGFYRNTGTNEYKCLIRSNAESTYALFATTFTIGEWEHWAFVYNGTNLLTYKNGVQCGNSAYGSSGLIYCPVMYIGNSKFGNTPASENEEGQMSDFRFYSTALSVDDILDLYKTSASIDNLQNIHSEMLDEKDDAVSDIKKISAVSAASFYESNSVLLSNKQNGGYTPKADTNNSCLDMGVVDFSDYVDLNQDLQIHIECDLEWTAFAAGTGGSFVGFWWQGSQFKRSSSSWVWTEGNPVTNALNNAFNPRNATTVSTAGRHHYDIVATISASFQQNVSKLYYGFRCDYSNGTGKITVKNFKATPYQYCNARIGKEFISANSFIEK